MGRIEYWYGNTVTIVTKGLLLKVNKKKKTTKNDNNNLEQPYKIQYVPVTANPSLVFRTGACDKTNRLARGRIIRGP